MDSAAASQQLNDQFSRHGTFCKALMDGYALINADGDVIKCNTMLGQIAGVKPKQLLKSGKLEQFVSMTYKDQPLTLRQLVEQNTTKRFEPVVGKTIEGNTLVLILGVHHFYQGDQYLGSFIVVRDITAESSLEGKFEHRVTESLTDALTGVNNREHFNKKGLELNVQRTADNVRTYSMAMLDIDHFKKINDKFGHDAGDYTLKLLGQILRQAMRTSDMAFRYGGEEFCLYFPDAEEAGAKIACEKLRQKIEQTRFEFNGSHIPVTVSIGIATFTGKDDSADAVIARADIALYQSKQGGRNRVTCHAAQATDLPSTQACG